MLTLKCLASGSDGNCYLLSDEENRTLVIECGVSSKDVKIAIDFDVSRIVGVIATHAHTDHFKHFAEFEKMGCDTFAPHVKGKIRDNREFFPYSIQSFQLPHGDTTSYGFLIRHIPSKETLLYMSDFEYCRYVFKACKVNHYLIECNYQPEYVDYDAPNLQHKISGHCSLATCKSFIKANVNEYMQNVILCHLGKSSTNPDECVNAVENVAGCSVNVDYARPKTVYELKNYKLPFATVGGITE